MVIVREFREAWRRLTRRPGYALLSIAVLGVGLGVVLFLFSLVNTLIVSPLPYPQANRLVAVGEAHQNGIGIGDIDTQEYIGLHHDLKGMDAIGGYVPVGANLDTGSGATFYRGTRLTASMLSMLGVKPILGRGFDTSDDKRGAPRVMLISASLWRHMFAANPGVIGRKVKVNGHWTTIIGVLPKRFGFHGAAQVWLPLRVVGSHLRQIYMVARRKPGVSLATARQELRALDAHLRHVSTTWRRQERIVMKPLAHVLVQKERRRWVWLMFAASVLVLLLACVNVGNLQLVQTLNRRRELALRSALGSSRRRLMMGALAESLWLSVAAFAIALPIVHFGNYWVVAMFLNHGHPPNTWAQYGMHGWTWAFAAGLALFSTAVAGMVSAWRASRANLQGVLRDGGKGSSGGFAHVARTLVVVEVALTVILLVGAGTFVRALDSLLAEPAVGATYATQILTARVNLPRQAYPEGADRVRFYQEVVQRLRHAPGVVDATAANTVPSAILGSHESVSLPGHAQTVHGWPKVEMGIVGSHFLHTYSVKLLQGRFFKASDKVHSQQVAVIDAKMAAVTWPHQNPLGRKLVIWPGKPYAKTLTIVGVIESLQLSSGLNTPLPGLLLPLDQSSFQSPFQTVGLAVRMHAGDMAAAKHDLAAAVHAVAPQAAIFDVRTQAQDIASSRVGLHVLTDVFGALGLIALLLAAAGLYGVLAFSVAQRTQEIGIRRAIGAGHLAIAKTIGRQLAWQLGIGLAVGLALALPWSGLLANPDLHTRAHDPAVFVPVSLVVVGVSVLAALVPLVRALRVDPAEALRYE